MLIGILGGGQLGRMLALAGYPLGMEFRFLDPSRDAPAGQVGELIVGDFTDHAALDRFAAGLDFITYEFENVPPQSVEYLATKGRVAPPVRALRTGQDRSAEKAMFTQLGIPVPAYTVVRERADLAKAAEHVGLPCVMKTLRLGYDGKGQAVVKHTAGDTSPRHVAARLEAAWITLDRTGVIVEKLVPFSREVSIIACRGANGSIVHYPLAQNVHRHGILRLSTAPAPDPGGVLTAQAQTAAKKILEHLNYVGVLAIEFFLQTAPGAGHGAGGKTLLANEVAPRVHNSGHWSIEGSICGQFENHLRAIAGLPLGSTESAGPVGGQCAMVNLIGGAPSTDELLAIPGVSVHLYGKEPRAGRKIGHVTVRAPNVVQLQERLNTVTALAEAHAQG